MTQFDPPLTEIKTPHKDQENEFKYPPPPSTKVWSQIRLLMFVEFYLGNNIINKCK